MSVRSNDAALPALRTKRAMTAGDDHDFRQTVSHQKARKSMNTGVSTIFDDPLQEYGGGTDYTEIFIDQMNCLYLLSFLLTAEIQLTEKCFSKALDEYVQNVCGFMEWAKQDGRRAVLRHAVQIIKPAPRQAYGWAFQEMHSPRFQQQTSRLRPLLRSTLSRGLCL